MGCDCCEKISPADYAKCQQDMERTLRNRKPTSYKRYTAPCGELFEFGAKFARPKKRKKRNMKNIPKRIYLQIGDLTDKDDRNIDFNELSDVCWSSEKIFKTDIEFIRKPDAARKSIESIANEANGRSRACKKCQYLMKCTPDISEVCRKAYLDGYKKGYNKYKNRLR